MVYSYYPGCTLRTKAIDLDRYAKLCAEKLGATLEEVENWQCCGAVYPMAEDEIATRLSSIRTLNYAKNKGQTLVTVCSACHNVVKRVNEDMKHNKKINEKANNYLALDEPYNGETKVIHYLELLRDEIGFEKIKETVGKALEGKKIAAYYGCLLLRPGKVMALDNPENPSIMEDLISAMGAESVYYPYRNECCGAYTYAEDKTIAEKNAGRIGESAKNAGADMIVTACPLCMYNLKKNTDIPVYYFTELLAEALGVKEE